MAAENKGEKRFDMILGKQRARARLREFIGKHLHNRRNARVLCLPGEHGREIEHVYRKLGFQDKNIVGVEADPKTVPGVRAHYPQITVYSGTINDFIVGYVEQEDAPPFDVVSLDYCGAFSPDKFAYLRLLAVQNKLADNVIVATNLFAGREQKDKQWNLKHSALGALIGGETSEKTLARLDGGEASIDKIMEQQDAISLSDARDLAPGAELVNEITHYAAAARLHFLHGVGKTLQVNKFQSFIRDALGRLGVQADPCKGPMIAATIATNEIAALTSEILEKFPPPDSTPELCRTSGLIWGKKVLSAFFDKYGQGRVPVAAEAYSYINDAGHRMVSDFFCFRYQRDKLARLPDAVQIENGHLVLNPLPEDFDHPMMYVKYIQDISNNYQKIPQLWSQNFPKRVDLGGGALPFDSERTKAKVVASIKKGRPDAEIMNKYPITVGTLRALRAHVTMGNL